ncbi:MAG: hypothetical protein L3J01_05925 [Thiomicrorhabdus sp.]|nr:hypothetical protein [Thiomicrorhabdus sp.]
MNLLKYLIAFAFFWGISSTTGAAIPPPPVNQNLGIPDTSFSNFGPDLCKACHWASARGDDPLSGAPVKPGYNPDRHHLAVNTEIDGKPEFPPFRDADGDGVNDTVFGCLNCHKILTQGVDIETAILDGVIYFNYRNCLNCHERDVGPLTVHHATDLAQTGFCFKCHGGLVRGIDVDTLEGKKPDPNNVNETIPVVINSYGVSMITPWRSNKPNGDNSQINHAGTKPGNCNFCHNTASGNTDQGGTPEVINLPNGNTFIAPILNNEQNHHNTGFFEDARCAWCHKFDFDQEEIQSDGQAIKICQRCHDIPTLHNIEFDKDGNGITPGEEEPYYGHIGNEKNCWGCHGFTKNKVQNQDGEWVDISNQNVVVSDDNNALMNSVSSALIPTINTLSLQSIPSGEAINITIMGMNMVNSSLIPKYVLNSDGSRALNEQGKEFTEISTIVWSSEVVLTDKNNNAIVIVPDYQDTGKLEFIIPETMTTGVYQVSLKKAGHVSNPIGLTITPAMATKIAITLRSHEGLVILSGINFMETVNGMSYKMVDQNGKEPARTYLWRDDLIVALFEDVPESVTIKTLYDERTFEIHEY